MIKPWETQITPDAGNTLVFPTLNETVDYDCSVVTELNTVETYSVIVLVLSPFFNRPLQCDIIPIDGAIYAGSLCFQVALKLP